MRKPLVVAALAAGLLGLGGTGGAVRATTLPAGIEGCIAVSPGANVNSAPAGNGNLLYNAKCSYTATRPAAYMAAADSWTITRSKMVAGKKKLVARHTGNRTSGGPHCNTLVVQKGEIVDVTVTYGIVAVGAPTPKDADPHAPKTGVACPKFPV